MNIAVPALLAAAVALAAGCASVDASTQKSSAAKPAAAQADDVEVGYITGSRLPRKATQNTQGVKQSSGSEWQRYQAPAPLKGD